MFTIGAESISFKHVEVFYQTVDNKSTVLNFFKFPNLPARAFSKKERWGRGGLSSSFQSFVHKNLIGHFRNEWGRGGGGGGGGGGGTGTPPLFLGSLPGTLFAYCSPGP